jgi:hypothetical protein
MGPMTLRALIASALLLLAACGDAPSGDKAAPSSGGGVVLASTRNLPDWLLVARQRDCANDAPAEEQCPLGEVHFNQRTITRDAQGFADIWVQASHGQPQLYAVESGDTRTTVRFTHERIHYRFNCAAQQFAVIERQIMGANETVVARDEPVVIYRAPLHRSITHIVMPIACRGG